MSITLPGMDGLLPQCVCVCVPVTHRGHLLLLWLVGCSLTHHAEPDCALWLELSLLLLLLPPLMMMMIMLACRAVPSKPSAPGHPCRLPPLTPMLALGLPHTHESEDTV